MAEFEEFLSDMVCMTEVEENQHHDEIQEEHEHGRLTMQESLKVYITQQVCHHTAWTPFITLDRISKFF